jgi:predicted ester cyclase
MTDTNEVMQEYFDALLHGRDFARFFAPDVVWTTMETGDQVVGREAVRDLILSMHKQAFDAHPELIRLITGDDAAVAEALFIGRHVGTWGDVPATGRDVRVPYAVSYDLAGGSITELRAYISMAALHAQLTQTAGRSSRV